jgi:hypothetical protein
MKMQRLFPTAGEVKSMDLKTEPKKNGYEKNWSPLTQDPAATDGSERYLFSRNVDPHHVVSCAKVDGACIVAHATENPSFFTAFKRIHNLRALHLGTNAVQLPNGKHVALFHGLPADGSRGYLNFVYVVEPTAPYGIVGVGTKPLELPLGTVGSGGYAFTANLAWVDGLLAVSYGVKDRSSNFYILDPKQLLEGIEAIESYMYS